MPERLPIYEIEKELLAALPVHRRCLVSAPTGSGKSTQIPQMLLDNGVLGNGQVVILQPRRLAARLLASRVAWERKSELGKEVGYQIRFENHTSAQTRIRFVTEGVLLRQMLRDPALKGVSTLVFDEFHERHLYGDITLARALELQESLRPDLNIVVMSATLEVSRFAEYLKPCQLIESRGRMFPVEIQYALLPAYADKRPVWEQAAGAFCDFVSSGGVGDVLIFMPGGFEIAQTIEAIRRCEESRGFLLLPLHGELPPHDQDAAVARHERRKVVVATNVAETSLTIDGIRCVIDSGLARIPRYDPYRGINTLLIEKTSRASADQRTGRAGRTAPGVCLRLWSREEHGHRPQQELPEIKRLDLAEVVLTLKAAGIADLRQFRWLEAPEEQALAHAEQLLVDLGALTAQDSKVPLQITETGRKMLAFPLHPRYARMLLAAQDFGCVHEACLVAALTQGRDLLVRNAQQSAQAREDLVGINAASDFDVLLRSWKHVSQQNFNGEVCRQLGINAAAARQVGPLFQQFVNIARQEGLDVSPHTGAGDSRKRHPLPSSALHGPKSEAEGISHHKAEGDALYKCILMGFSDRVARRSDSGTLRSDLVHGRRGSLARESVVQNSQLFVAAEVQEVEGKEKSVNTLLSLATAIEEAWLRELFPEDIVSALNVFYDAASKRVYADEQLRFRNLIIGAHRVEPPPRDEAARLLSAEVLAGRLELNEWDAAAEQWILRLNLLSKWCPEFQLPPITEDDRKQIIEMACHGAFSYKDIKDHPVKSLLKGWLSPAQQALLDKHAPERLAFPNGRPPKVTYDASNPPFVAVRIQELYDVTATPRIAMGRIPVLLHILAPNMRPVQITQDLAGFWRDHYPRIKQELQRKYPRHNWR